VPLGPGAVSTPISWADPRTGRLADAGNGGRDGDAVVAPVEPGVGDGVADASDDAGPDAGVVFGDGLMADAHATTRKPTTIIVEAGNSEERIRSPCGSADYGSMIVVVYSTVLSGATARTVAEYSPPVSGSMASA